MPRDYLPLSPLLPLEPDWPELAKECSRAYWAYVRIDMAVTAGEADGKTWWEAKARADKAASTIATWSDDPDLYGRLLAREKILRELGHISSPSAPLCPNAANNTPYADCCDQCRYELGL